jgi:CubicO group peptidase (beta-lactamase class C family)
MAFEIPRVSKPEDVGLLSQRLQRLRDAFQADITDGFRSPEPDMRYGRLTPTQFGALAPVPENGIGFGPGFVVRTHLGRNPLPGSVGDYSWSGMSGTYFWIDSKQQLIAVLMMQAPIQRLRYRYLMRTLVYQAIVE